MMRADLIVVHRVSHQRKEEKEKQKWNIQEA